MKLEYISSKTLNFPYIAGKNVTLQIKDAINTTEALVFHIDEKRIGISVAYNPSFIKGDLCYIELLYKENLLRLECKIKTFDDGILYLTMPRTASIIQQRGDLRVGCNIKCTIERFSTGKIKNISAGGAYIALDTPITSEIFDEDSFRVCFSIEKTDFRLECSSVETTDKYMRVKFKNLDNETKEFLTLYCCSTDADIFRRAKFER